jgi:hypothetical protein
MEVDGGEANDSSAGVPDSQNNIGQGVSLLSFEGV